jgi:GT2 family glycosyltransferase
MKLSLITATYNQLVSLEKNFQDLALQRKLPKEIPATDDGSTDHPRDNGSRKNCAMPVNFQMAVLCGDAAAK